MSLYKNYGVGLRNVGSYQVSGQPFITGSINLDNATVHMVEFPYVCKGFTVWNLNPSGSDIRVHFASGSGTAVTVPGDVGAQTAAATDDVQAGLHYITIFGGTSPNAESGSMPNHSHMTFECKCSKFYISNLSGKADLQYQVFAELTNIGTTHMYTLTGSGVTEIG